MQHSSLNTLSIMQPGIVLKSYHQSIDCYNMPLIVNVTRETSNNRAVILIGNINIYQLTLIQFYIARRLKRLRNDTARTCNLPCILIINAIDYRAEVNHSCSTWANNPRCIVPTYLLASPIQYMHTILRLQLHCQIIPLQHCMHIILHCVNQASPSKSHTH